MSWIRVFGRMGAARTGLLVLLCAMAVAGCSVMSSAPVIELGQGYHGCSSSLGSYVLPRSVLNIQIRRANDNFVLAQLAEKRVPDNAHNYCLEHDSNPFAEDSIRVYKNTIVNVGNATTPSWSASGSPSVATVPSPYLQLIASKAVDHSAGIVRNLIRAVFIGLSNNPDFPGRAALAYGTTSVVADHEVDPFNFYEMAELNQGIRRFGFCLVLSGYTFNERTQSASAYCDAPKAQAQRHAPPSHKAIKSMRWLVPKPAAGIFYRPRAPYKVEVYTKHRPDDRGEWQLALVKTVQMENIMPVVSVGVDRALFATRRTGLIFDDGELADVCISRGNSITGATDIVLDVVYGIINLPAATIQGVINDTDTRKQLLEKRRTLINAQEQYIKFLQGGTPYETSQAYRPLNLSEENRPSTVPAPSAPDLSSTSDAGSIYTSANSNPLKDICAKLQAAGIPGVTPDDPSTAQTGGNF